MNRQSITLVYLDPTRGSRAPIAPSRLSMTTTIPNQAHPVIRVIVRGMAASEKQTTRTHVRSLAGCL